MGFALFRIRQVKYVVENRELSGRTALGKHIVCGYPALYKDINRQKVALHRDTFKSLLPTAQCASPFGDPMRLST